MMNFVAAWTQQVVDDAVPKKSRGELLENTPDSAGHPHPATTPASVRQQ